MNNQETLNLQKMIMESMKERDLVKTRVYKNILAKKQELLTDKNAKSYNIATEINLLRKMVSELQGDYDIAIKANRMDIAEESLAELNVVKPLLPKEASIKDIQSVIDKWIAENGRPEKKQMRTLIKVVKEKLPSADGSTVATIVKKIIY